jgi:probable HAF family extracellular repeat protein
MKKHLLHIHKNKLFLIAAFILLPFIDLSAQQPTLNWVGTLGGNSSHIYGISADGSSVVGVSTNSNYEERAFRWTPVNGMENLGTLGGSKSKALALSADGSVIVGSSDNSDGVRRAFKWTEANGMQDLGVSDYSEAVAVSDDGSIIVYNDGMDGLAYRWTSSGGSINLGTLGGNSTTATDISSDGSVIVGYSYDSTNNPYAFRWVSESGMEKIGTYYSFARAVSGDGNTVTGSETGAAGLHRAFRWTSSGGFEFNIAGNFTYGLAASYDGAIIVGDGDGAIQITTSGVENLNQVYSTLLTGGSVLDDATGISSNGLFIVGNGTNSTSELDEGYYIAVNGITSITDPKYIVPSFLLSQNYPNPFNPNTKIVWQTPVSGYQSLKVYDVLGNEVEILVDEFKEAGNYEINFNASKLSSGVYIYKLQTGIFVSTKKMVVLK